MNHIFSDAIIINSNKLINTPGRVFPEHTINQNLAAKYSKLDNPTF